MKSRGYSMLMVLMLLSLLGVAVGGIFGIVVSGAQTSGAMIERRRSFYACDGMGRQLAALGQAFLARNILEDVPESVMEAELRQFLPRITPPGFEAKPEDLVIPERKLQEPVAVEMITTGPFSGLEVQLQTIEMRFQAKRTASGAVCRAEQTLSLGRIALFQFFAFSDLPQIEVFAPGSDLTILRGRIHSNGRLCLGGGLFSEVMGLPYSLRLDTRLTAVERILHVSNGNCLGSKANIVQSVGVMGRKAPGNQSPAAADRLTTTALQPLFSEFNFTTQSGCNTGGGGPCRGGWRSFALREYLGRMQDRDHEVQELTLPVDPPIMFTQVGMAANGGPVRQEMRASSTRPNTRLLVEPVLTRDPEGFSRNKMAFKAQIRIIDGVWYVKDPGPNNSLVETEDDGPWPGIPIWSDHPGEYTTNLSTMTAEGVEGIVPVEVGQSDIRDMLDSSSDARLRKAQWSKRAAFGAPPTPRRFSYYAFVDRVQAKEDANTTTTAPTLRPTGQGLQYGRVVRRGSSVHDVDPPAVVSYGAITPVSVGGMSYWLPGVRTTDARPDTRRGTFPVFNNDERNIVGFCGGRSDDSTGTVPLALVGINDVGNNVMGPAVPPPRIVITTTSTNSNGDTTTSTSIIPDVFPAAGSPLPFTGTTGQSLTYKAGNDAWEAERLCAPDTPDGFRYRMRLALLESARTGFRDTNVQNETVSPFFAPAQPDILPININLHALQEALADRTPGELGSYFCTGCLWESFDGTIFISNTWQGSMLSRPFPGDRSLPPPPPMVAGDQPRAPNAMRSTTGALPYPLCASFSDEDSRAHAQVVGFPFLEADTERTRATAPYEQNPRPADKYLKTLSLPVRPSGSPPENVATPTAATLEKATFTIPNCAAYSLTNGGPFAAVRPTAVRLINGRNLNFNAPKCGPNRNLPCHPALTTSSGQTGVVSATKKVNAGVNFVTNMPVYIVGDMNLTSEIINVQTGQKATDWIPLMITGDTITTLSNNWSDNGSRWGVGTGNFGRGAANTQYNMLLLTGLSGSGVYDREPGNPTSLQELRSGGLLGAMRLMENWRDTRHTFRGSIVLGWMPVYTQWGIASQGGATWVQPRIRDWQFDRHLNATINQPPDSPVFDVTALRSWRRE